MEDVIYVIPAVDYMNGAFYLDYAVRGEAGYVNRSEKFTDAESASTRLWELQKAVEVNKK
jgi:hypothetical protein